MSLLKEVLDRKKIRRLSWLVIIMFVLLVCQCVHASAYYSLVIRSYGTVGSPPVILQNGTVGTSTIYTNNTSAKASVEAPLFDYVDINDFDVDSSADKGSHSDFSAQQAGPDSTYDTLKEENTEAIEDYVDNNSSDVDNSSDVGTHSNFENQKAQDSSYDTFTEASQANTYSLDATGGYMIIGDGTPDWGSTTGTISFWVKLDSSVQGRFYGQDGNMETRWAGTNLVLDWGGTASMTSAYSFSADTWYFVAIVWDENNDNLFLYVGDENNAPTQDSNSLSGIWTSTTPAPTQNRFLNGLGGVEPVDGHGDDLRYWNVARSLAEIQSDYNKTLSGSETNLRSYFKLDNDFDDVGPNNDDGSGSGSYAFSTDVSFSGSSDYDLDIELQWTSVIDFLPTERLCIYTGTLGDEDLRVDCWNGTGWENLATDLIAHSCNSYTVSLTSTTFTIRFKGGNETGDGTQDQWQIDATLLRVEGTGSKEDAVDNDTSNVDSSADLGSLINFDNMKAADSTYANLTELSPGGITYINRAEASGTSGTSAPVGKPTGTAEDDFMIALLVSTIGSDTDGSTMSSAPSGWTNEHDYIQSTTSGQHVYIYWKVASASEPSSYTWTWTSSCGWVAQITTFRGVDTSSPIHVEGTVNQETSNSPMSPSVTTTVDNCMIWLYDMSDGTAVPASGGAPSGTTWIDQTEVASPGNGVGISTAYFVQASGGATGNKDWILDASDENSGQQYALNPLPANYQLDQEVQWTNVPYSLPNGNFSISCGSMGAEDIKVDVWNETGWETIFTDLSSGWNNVSISNWLTASTFTIRFIGGNETGDSNQDTWQIDIALIHLWYEGGESYELDLEVQWTNVDYTRTNEELCVRTGSFSGSEDIQVRVWNSTGSSWHWIMNLTASQWNNVSVTSYLVSSTFAVQFLGGTETGDATQNSWNIDAALLHVWTGESTHDYVDNNTSDIGSPADIGTHSNFTAQQYGPDSINDTLTEGGGGTVWLWQEDTSGYTPTSSYETFEFWNSWTTNATTSGTITKLGIYVFADPGNSPQVKLGIYDDSGGSPNNLLGETNAATIAAAGWLDLDLVGGGVSIAASTTYHIAHITDIAPTTQWRYYKTATPVSDYRGSIVWPSLFDPAGTTSKSASYRYGAYRAGYDEPYRLDLEVQWVGVDYDEGEKELCIHGGSMASEDLLVDVWNGTGWQNLFADFSNGWNNASVSSYLTSSTFTIRFKGGNETSDITQDSWNIDATLLHVSTEDTYDYVLRVNNTVTDSWQIRLKQYDDSNINRLQNCTIYFHNSTDGASSQITIENGLFASQNGQWYDLGNSETIYIAMIVQANSIGTSYINAYLEVRIPNSTIYAEFIITFEIT